MHFTSFEALNSYKLTASVCGQTITVVIIKTAQHFAHLSLFWSWLSPDEQLRARGFAFAHLFKNFIVQRGLLRMLLAQWVGSAPQLINFTTHALGKPCLKDVEGYHFNMSHSDQFSVYAFACAPLGVDVEEMKTINEQVGDLVFSHSENAALRSMHGEAKDDAFLRLWTKKEAISKALGLGLAMDFKTISLGIAALAKKRFVYNDTVVVDISRPPLFLAIACAADFLKPGFLTIQSLMY